MVKKYRTRYKMKKLLQEIKPVKIILSDIPKIKEIYISIWGTIGLFSNLEFRRVIKQNISYLYKIDNEVIAFCLIDYQKKENISEICLLCVKKEYQGFHLGESLLSFCLNKCSNLNKKNFSLHVSTTNFPAINLYEKKGFTIKTFIKKYYNDENPKG